MKINTGLGNLVDIDTPPLNMKIANGIAVHQMKGAEKLLDDVWWSISREFPPEVKYVGCRPVSYREEYQEHTRRRSPRPTYDVAESNFYLMRYDFTFQGQPMKPKYIYLPYVSEHCTIHISNSRYLVSPVLADRVITISASYIFIRLLRDKMTFEKSNHHFKVNDVRDTVSVIWTDAYHKNEQHKKLKNPLKVKCALAHYLFCKYGFTKTMQLFGHTTPVLGDHETIDHHRYPQDKWMICKSNASAPPKWGSGYWQAPTLRVAIPRDDWERNPIIRNLVAGLFYVVDHFADKFTDPTWVDNERWMMTLLGQIIWAPSIPLGKLANDTAVHLGSLDDYIDSIMIDKFKQIEKPVTDIYQLFAMLIENFNKWRVERAEDINSMYGKELNVTNFLLEQLIFLIVRFNFRLKAAAKKGLKYRDVENALLAVKTGALFGLTKSSGCLSTTSSPGDNKAFKLTTILIPQTASQKGGNKTRGASDDPSLKIHVSVAEIGGAFNPPKSDPSGRGRLNPHALVDDNGLVGRHPDLIERLDRIQKEL